MIHLEIQKYNIQKQNKKQNEEVFKITSRKRKKHTNKKRTVKNYET